MSENKALCKVNNDKQIVGTFRQSICKLITGSTQNRSINDIFC